jgi:hypothetical protein
MCESLNKLKEKLLIMSKYLIIVTFLHVIMTKEIHAKEEDFELTYWKETETTFDDAIGNCDR